MLEFLILLALVLLNAVLSGTEMAVVSARRSKLQSEADRGNRRARAALDLRTDPERFLATVQVGITLVGALAGAFGGATFAKVLEPWIAAIPGCEAAADEIAFGLVVAIITYLSVVIGELIPKSLALRHAETIAMAMAKPMRVLEAIASPIIWLLVKSSNLLLKPFHDSTNFVESKLTREDLAAMVTEATEQSDLPASARQVLERAVEFSSLRLADVMVHRRWVVALNKNADRKELRAALVDAGHRRVPVYEGAVDNVVGYVLRDDVMANLWDGTAIDVAALMRPAFFLPETTPAERALRELQSRHLHLAIVLDEHGGLCGIVTLEDLIEELVGEIFHERDIGVGDTIRKQADGSWLVQGAVDVREFERSSGIEIECPEDVRSMGGLLLHLAGGMLPAKDAKLQTTDGVVFEVVEVSARRVRLLRVRGPRQPVTLP
jgi:putative hemolysin